MILLKRNTPQRSWTSAAGDARLAAMERPLVPETEAKLNEPESRTNGQRAAEQLADYNEWFESKVRSSIAAVRRGEAVTNKSVRRWLERRESA